MSGGGGWVHPNGANSMAVSGLGCQRAAVVVHCMHKSSWVAVHTFCTHVPSSRTCKGVINFFLVKFALSSARFVPCQCRSPLIYSPAIESEAFHVLYCTRLMVWGDRSTWLNYN